MYKIIFNVLNVLLITTVSAASPQTIVLNDGNRMPRISLGTVVITNIADEVVKPVIIQAIESGYRQIDTAAIYKNEKQIGEGIAEAINRGLVTREELWITTKLPLTIGKAEEVLPALQESLKKMNLDYVDLYLIHEPWNLYSVPEHDILSIWEGMVQVKKLNLARSIGVSNFNSTHINRSLAHSEVAPAVNEIEIDLGTIPIPKSSNTEHIKMNIDVFDFQLTPEEVYSINELNQDVKVYCFDPEPFAGFTKYYNL